MAGRPPRTEKVQGVFIRLPQALVKRVEHCHALLQRQHGPKTTQNTAYEHIIEAGCAALEGTLEGGETLGPVHMMVSKLSHIAGDDIDVPGYGFPEDPEEEDLLAPASSPNGTRAAAPQPTTQPAIPLALEPAPKTAHPAQVPQAAEKALPKAATGMQNCDAGKGHPPYPITMSECRKCRKARNARDHRSRQKAKRQGQPA